MLTHNHLHTDARFAQRLAADTQTTVEYTLPVVAKVMADAPMPAVNLSVPLHVDAHAADNWEEAH